MALNVYSLERDGEKSLSKNFKVKEFRCKDGSDPIFIDSELGRFCRRSVTTSASR